MEIGVKESRNQGLTSLGKELVEKLVKTNIAIDLSHANEKTFYDIINICKNLKQKGDNPIVFASHSNCKSICDVSRNLSDNQILEITNLDGIIGMVSIKPFCINNKSTANKKYKQAYMDNICYIKNLTGNENNIALSTDDMRYYRIQPKYYQNVNIFKQSKVRKDIYKLLKKIYRGEEIENIMSKNFEIKILQRL